MGSTNIGGTATVQGELTAASNMSCAGTASLQTASITNPQSTIGGNRILSTADLGSIPGGVTIGEAITRSEDNAAYALNVAELAYNKANSGGGNGGGGNYQTDVYANDVLVLANAALNFNNSATINVVAGELANTLANIQFTANVSAVSGPAYAQANAAYAQANAAYTQANAAYTEANTANGLAQTASTTANSAYAEANAANSLAQSAYSQANTAYAQANAANALAQSAYTQANSAYAEANAANALAQTASTTANSAYAEANLANGLAQTASTTANSAYAEANLANGLAQTASTTANSAYAEANVANSLAQTASTTANSAYGEANLANSVAQSSYTQANSSANTVAAFANGTIVLAAANINFNNSSTLNVQLTANGTTQTNIAFQVNVPALIGSTVTTLNVFTTNLNASGFINTAGNLYAGNVITANINASGYINAVGNVYGSNVIVAANVFAGGNVNVSGAGAFANIVTIGNMTLEGSLPSPTRGRLLIGDGSGWQFYIANQNTGGVVSNLVDFADTGLVTFNYSVNVTGYVNATANIYTGNVITANVNASGYINSAANVYAGNIQISSALAINTASSFGLVTINLGDANTAANGIGGAWKNTYVIIGDIATNTTTPALGMGYDRTNGSAVIAAVEPGVSWNTLTIYCGDLRVANGNVNSSVATSLTGPNWQNVSFGTNFSNFGSPYSNVQYYQDATGRVYLRGLMASTGNVKTSNTMFSGIPASTFDAIIPIYSQAGWIECFLGGGSLTQFSGANVTATFWTLDGVSYQTK